MILHFYSLHAFLVSLRRQGVALARQERARYYRILDGFRDRKDTLALRGPVLAQHLGELHEALHVYEAAVLLSGTTPGAAVAGVAYFAGAEVVQHTHVVMAVRTLLEEARIRLVDGIVVDRADRLAIAAFADIA